MKDSLNQVENSCPKELAWRVTLYRGYLAICHPGRSAFDQRRTMRGIGFEFMHERVASIAAHCLSHSFTLFASRTTSDGIKRSRTDSSRSFTRTYENFARYESHC